MDNNEPQAPSASEDTRKVMEEIREEGDHFEGVDKPEEQDQKPNEQKPTSKPPAENEQVDEEEGDEDDEEAGKDEDDKKTPPKRTSKFVPVKKYNDLRHDVQDLNKKIADLEAAANQKPNTAPHTEAQNKKVFDKAAEFAEKLGLEEEAVNEFANYILNMAKADQPVLSDDIQKKLESLDKITEERQQSLAQQQEDTDFEKGFEKVLTEFPDLANRKDEFKRLAFTEGYESTPLEVLATYFVSKNKTVKTAEGSKRGAGTTQVLDFETMTEEQLDALEGQDLENYRNYIMKKSGRY